MSDAKKQSSLIATLAVCAVFVALVSFFLPFVSISFFGTYSYSAIELIEEIIDYPEFPDVGVLISLICTVLAIVFSLLAMKKRGMEIGTIVTSAAGMILMIVAMTSDIGLGQSAIDYAAIGLWRQDIYPNNKNLPLLAKIQLLPPSLHRNLFPLLLSRLLQIRRSVLSAKRFRRKVLHFADSVVLQSTIANPFRLNRLPCQSQLLIPAQHQHLSLHPRRKMAR